ncbi:MAG: PDZ domain-containing protein [Planctomycetes bacterium]|nr:PDZ domain-containing protein [Planctomycetota bacterium]
MRTLTCSLIAMMALACVNLAQDVPQPAKEVDTTDLLARYLKSDGKEKDALRKQLLELSADELQKTIHAWQPAKLDKPGVTEFETLCPDGHKRPYWVYVPEEYDVAKRYPLLVCMHGGVSGWPMRSDNEDPSAGEYSIQYFLPNLTDEQKREVVILGCSAGVPETGMDSVWWALKGQQNVLHMISETKRRVSIDDDRVIVTGHSDGGSGTFGFAYRMPDTFAGFYAMNGCPLVPPLDGSPVFLENMKGENFYCFNGGRDTLYPAKRMTPIYDQANGLGATIKYTVYPKLTHQVGDVLEDEVANFMGKQLKDWRRDLLPAEIDWACSDPARGRRAWLSIDEISDLGAANTAPKNAEIEVPAGRPTLGVRLQRNVDAPTVENVVKGSAAEDMGIKEGDVIKKLDDHEIKSMQDLLDALDTKAPGDDVTIVVDRAGEEKTLKGSFPKAQEREQQKEETLVARVIAKLEAPGRVTLSVRNAAKVTIYVAPSMLDGDGKLRVSLKVPKGEIGIAVTKTVEVDKGMMIDQFEKTGDRTLPWTGRIELDVHKLLGDKVKPAKPDQKEDEF